MESPNNMDNSSPDLGAVSIADKLIAISQTYENWSDKSFNLNEINHLLENYQEDDFNAFKAPIMSMSDFRAAVNAAKATKTDPNAPWLIVKCSCGNDIQVSHRRVLWGRRTKIGLPTLCKDCMTLCLGDRA